MPLIDIEYLLNGIKKVIDLNGKIPGDINFIFCSDEYLLDINVDYLNHDYYTDIITFDYCENNIISGDIFISINRVKENSIEFNQTFLKELHRVIVHGVLHLLGIKDKSLAEREEMTINEDKYLPYIFIE